MQAESMQVKSYFADSVERAIQAARQELGADAVLITSRRAAPEVSSRGAYEVVLGIPGHAPASDPVSENQDLSQEVALLRDQLENIKLVLQHSGAGANPKIQPGIKSVQLELAEAGLDDEMIQSITNDVWNSRGTVPAGEEPLSIRDAAIESLRKRLRFAPEFAPVSGNGQRAVVFVGPPGAGKTSTLAKFAMRECLGRRLSVRIISVETHRVAAQEKLRGLAKIMGFGFTAANSMREFIEAMDEFRGKDVLLIDTPGFSRDDFEFAGDLIRFLRQMASKEIHLVLPASMNRNDLMIHIRRYAAFQPDYLLFTKLDETESRGAVLAAALEADKPLSYLAAGQGIPEDLQSPNWPALLGKLFQREKAAAVSAA